MTEPAKDLTVDEFTTGMREKIGENSRLDATFKFVFDDGRTIFIDGKTVPNRVSNDDQPAEVTLRMSIETLNKLHRKELNPTMAVMLGKIKLEGNMMTALKLDQIF